VHVAVSISGSRVHSDGARLSRDVGNQIDAISPVATVLEPHRSLTLLVPLIASAVLFFASGSIAQRTVSISSTCTS